MAKTTARGGETVAIPEQFIDEVIARTDLVDLVSEYVSLTKKGASYWGLCPFHGEKTPSFHVVPDRQIYKCFGCGKGGGAINFVMEEENLPYPDAIRHLAKRVGLQVPETEFGGSDTRRRREKILEINRQAARIFHQWLYAPEGTLGLDYLQKRRLSKATMTNFGLGFAPEGWDRLISALGELGYDKRDLLDAGLAVSNRDGRIYDRFRNRVMFPIIDVRGEVIGFGGRVMDDGTPKYLNSPETLAYNKSRNLFALNRAKRAKGGRVILTEGYMDTIALHQAGFDSAVASLGTALTVEHAQLLSRYFKEAVIAYDGDGAGISAAQRAIPLLEKAGLRVRVLRMQGAKDPDEYIKTFGREAFERLLSQSENHMDYQLAQISRTYDLQDDTGRLDFLREATGFLASLHSAVEREIYGGKVAQMAGISPESIAQEVKKELRRRFNREAKKKERRDLTPASQLQPKARPLRYENIRSARAEEGVVRLLMLDGTLAPELDGIQGEDFSSPLLGKVCDLLLERIEHNLSTALACLAPHLTGEEMDHMTQVMSQPQDMSHGRRAMADYIAVLQEEKVKRAAGSDDLLLQIQKRYQEKKAYMEEAQ